jgi:hypothetical protein
MVSSVNINSDLHEDDVDTTIEIVVVEENTAGVLVPVNISSATILQIKFISPNGTQITKAATLSTNGSDGKMKYVTEAGFLTPHGVWRKMGYLSMPNWEGHTEESTFYVNPVLF